MSYLFCSCFVCLLEVQHCGLVLKIQVMSGLVESGVLDNLLVLVSLAHFRDLHYGVYMRETNGSICECSLAGLQVKLQLLSRLELGQSCWTHG